MGEPEDGNEKERQPPRLVSSATKWDTEGFRLFRRIFLFSDPAGPSDRRQALAAGGSQVR